MLTSFVDFFTENIWPVLFPYFFWLNTIAVFVIFFMFLYLLKTKARIKELESEDEKKINDLFLWVNDKPKSNPRWDKIEKMAHSTSQSDWKLAIIEADSILDDLTKTLGFEGDNMGERMLNMNVKIFPYLNEAWKVHKLRNILAHETSYDLQRGEMEDAIDIYNLIFKSMNYI